MAALFQIRRGVSGSLSNGELYYNQTTQSLQLGTDTNSVITLAKLNETNSGSFRVSGDISASGNVFINGDTRIVGNLTFGDSNAFDTVTVVASLSSSLIPSTGSTFDLGNETTNWRKAYISSITGSLTGSVNGINLTALSYSLDSRIDSLDFFSSSQYNNDSSSFDSRTDKLEAAMSGSKRLYVSPDGDDLHDGTKPHKPFKTIKAAVESLYTDGTFNPLIPNRTTIFVGSGQYTENNPIALPPGVAIMGDNLRTVRLTAQNPTYDFFHVQDGNYINGLRFLDLQYPAFAFSFPASTATLEIDGGGISNVFPVYTHPNYTEGETPKVLVESPDSGGTPAIITAEVVDGNLEFTIVDGGSGYADGEKPHVSIQAPEAIRPFITTSPYIQNCSSITGPFTKAGVKVSAVPGAPTYRALPYDYSDIDEQGAGGGLRIDGNLCSNSSPLRSFVADAFTQVNQGGPGHLVINDGYTQFVSCFTTFCTYGFKVANGGFANVSNSVIDFGIHGLISKKYYPESYNTATAADDKSSTVVKIEIQNSGSGYTPNATNIGVTIFNGTSGPSALDATAHAIADEFGSIKEIIIDTPGAGYISKPNVSIDAPVSGIQATTIGGKASISNVNNILINVDDSMRGVDVGCNMRMHGLNYLVTSVTPGVGTEYHVTLLNISDFPSPTYVETGDAIEFYQLSNISTGGMVMEYVGSGVTYNALPFYGGIPIPTNEVQDGSNVNGYAPGRVFYTTVDNIGNLKIGDYFAVNQLTGEVSINAESFNLTGLNSIGPFRRDGFDAGVALNELSDNITLVNSIGEIGHDTAPTQFAVYGYVNTYSASANTRLDNLEVISASYLDFTSSYYTTSASFDDRVDLLETTASALTNFSSSQYNNDSSSFDDRLNSLNTYSASLKAAIEVSGSGVSSITKIYGDLIVEGTQSIINSENLAVKDSLIYLNNSSSITNPDLGIVGNYNDGTYAHTGIYRESNDGVWKVFDSLTDEPSGSVNSGHPSFRLANFQANEISASINGIGNVTLYSTSVDSRLTTYSASAWGAFQSASSYSSSVSSSLSSVSASLQSSSIYYSSSISGTISTISASFNTRINTNSSSFYNFSSSAYNNDSSSFDTRIGLLSSSIQKTDATQSLNITQASASAWGAFQSASSYSSSLSGRINALELTSQSLNLYTASVSTSVGLLQGFSGSEYKNDSSSFSTRISASTLTFNDTTGQTGIDFTQIGTQVSAIASGLSTTSNVQFASITASNNISSSGTVYCDTLVATTLVGATLPVLEYETNGTLGNILIKGATSKSIQVVDSIKFTGLSQNGVDQYSATGLELTGSLNVTNDITASCNLYVSGTIYTYELHTIIESSSIIRTSGSTFIGDAQNDILTITGSIYHTGSTSFSELTGSLALFSSSIDSRIIAATNEIQFATTASLNIISASAWGAFQSASSYSGSFYTTINNTTASVATISASAWGAFQSASSYSGSFYTTINNLSSSIATTDTLFAKLGSANTFTQNQIISGSLNVTGDVVAYATSDERLKDNIELISNPIEKVQQLKGVEFDWKAGMPKAGQHDYGVIAQDVIKVMPELVNQRPDGYYAVDYDKIIGLLIEVVKEQEKRIKDLENKIGS